MGTEYVFGPEADPAETGDYKHFKAPDDHGITVISRTFDKNTGRYKEIKIDLKPGEEVKYINHPDVVVFEKPEPR